MNKLIKAGVFDIKVEADNNILLIENGKKDNMFENILKELSSKLDDTDSYNTRVLDTYNGIETSIWFDSFDNVIDFSKEDIFEDTICFLLAKDMNYQLIENKEENKLENISYNERIKPKIPSHCVFIKSQDILLMETSTNAPTASTLHRGIIRNINVYKENLMFQAQYREDIIERLNCFIDNIKSIEMIDLNLEKYLKDTEDTDGQLQNFLYNPETKITAKLFVETDDWKTKALNFFTHTFHNQASKELNNIKITYKDESQKDDVIELYNNLVFLKVEKEFYVDDISQLREYDRLKYSQDIYKTMIEAYYESST
jgi:hypothetical protein